MFADLAHPGVFHTNDDGLIVVFSSERDRVQENMTSHNKYDDPVYLPRNLGVVKVPLNLKNETVMSQEEICGFLKTQSTSIFIDKVEIGTR